MFEILILALAIGLLLKMRGMSARMRRIEQQVKDLQARIDLGLVPATPFAPTPILTETSVKDGETAVAEAASETTVVAETPLAGDAVPQAASETAEPETGAITETIAPPAVPTETAPAKAQESLESIIGARWAVWAGGLTLAMGGLFLVRYSIESGLLGPGVRLMLAALFGLALLGAGEAIRRRMLPGIAVVHENAMVPGILTAAGTVSLFGSIYAAHGIYGFIGPATAFTLLALTSFATLGLSLLHGQALAGLGLLGSMVMPLLVASTAPSPWTLFIYLTITLAATQAASRFRGWQVVPVLANLGIGLWALLYLHFTPVVALTPPALALLAMIAIATYFWPGAVLDTHDRETPAPLLLRQPLGIMLSLSFALVIPVLSIIAVSPVLDADPVFVMAALLAAFAAIATVRHYMGWPALFAAAGAVIGSLITVLISADFDIDLRPGDFYPSVIAQPLPFNDTAMLLGLGALFLPLAFLAIRRKGERDPGFALLWSITGTVVPVVIGTICFIAYWADGIDWLHGLYGIAIALALLAAAEWVSRSTAEGLLRHAIDVCVAGSFAAATLALHALTDGLFTTVLLAVLGFAYVFATRHRPWPALPWMMVAACAGVFVRIAYDPTLVGALNLGRTPVFNQLLPGYGIPAALAIASAWLLGRWPEARVRNAMQAIAAVMGLLAVAVLLRHAMTGGMLEGPTPTLGEQSIYSLLLIGFSGILMALDFRSPSPVFRLGTMIAGGLSMLNILTLHIGALNPYFTGEDTGSLPLVNLLLLGYLMPALAYAGLALYARGRRPQPYVAALAIGSALLGFVWATLSVRRFWQGDNIAAWKGFMQGETYSYSVVWLAIGVGLLALGSRLDARSLRLASAVLVVISVAKAFLIDMSNLEGVLRALSFIGLGIVLIGIGLFYQKILSRPRAAREPAAEPAPPPA